MAAPLARPARRAGSNSARARAATPRATRSAQKGGTARHEMPTATAALPRCLRSCTHSIAPRTLDRPVCCVATLLAFCLPDARSTYHRAPSGCSPATLARLHSHASLKDSPQYRARARRLSYAAHPPPEPRLPRSLRDSARPAWCFAIGGHRPKPPRRSPSSATTAASQAIAT